MRFWDDMQEKYGFNDGGSTPPGADLYRAVYIQAVNDLATRRGSQYRAAAYDRPGMHNGCMVFFYLASEIAALGLTPQQLTTDAPQLREVPAVAPMALDDTMQDAITEAHDLDVDSYVSVRSRIHTKELTAALNRRAARQKKEPA